ncbi:MAG: hypothetical protein WCA77_10125, partial [Thermoplasmata archaeon]
ALRNAVAGVPLREHFADTGMKPLLRAMAKSIGLPDQFAMAPKKAWQYGSGVSSLVRKEFLR